MSLKLNSAITVIGIDIGKNSLHIVGHDQRSVGSAPRPVIMRLAAVSSSSDKALTRRASQCVSP
jgi:hypothetical protein